MKETQVQTNRGFTMLIGVLVASIMLSITLVIFNISLKQITLSTVGRNSQLALYAADTGLECALYWDISENGGGQFSPSNSNGQVECAGQTITTNSQVVGAQSGGGDTYINNSTIGGVALDSGSNVFQLDLEDDTCAIVRITKTTGDPVNAGYGTTVSYKTDTKIESRGYNTCDVNNPQRLERGLEVNY